MVVLGVNTYAFKFVKYSRLKEKDNAKSNLVLIDICGKLSHLALKIIKEEYRKYILLKIDNLHNFLSSLVIDRVSRMEHHDSANPVDDIAYQENDIADILDEGRPPSPDRGSMGRGRSSGRSSAVSSVVQPTSGCPDCEFPNLNEFSCFVYPLIDSYMDLTGDSNYEFRVVSYFMMVIWRNALWYVKQCGVR
ncbi:hypothetical protein M9H77_35927 [Catharanthus roseus]|uniref:Uncharacterized protein n=1 Tax=Catharanthus roseus TaxID=4058 RepID=A0ACB9ZUM5_CATRO|nr:hypothetical protein M9H77_35927 [Catharanthus roseus]